MAHGEIFVQLSVNMADDPKVRALARYGRDARPARDLYVQMILYCKANLTDGFVPLEQIGVLVYPDAPKVGARDAGHLAEVGLIERRGDAWYVLAFLRRNRSRQAVRDRSEEKKRASAKANHVRWHLERGIAKPDCGWCQGEPDSDPTDVSDHFVSGHELVTGASGGAANGSGANANNANGTQSSQLNPDDSYPKSESGRTPTGLHIGHRSEDIGHRTESYASDPQADPPPPSPPPAGPEPSSAASREQEGEGEHFPTIDLELVAKVREIRPDWSTGSIARALSRSEVLERPRELVTTAMLAVARDPASQFPGRLAHDGPWWQAAPARPAAPPKCDACNPFRRLEDAAGNDIGPCPTCHPSREEAS